jgi:prepilin-type N-terminal cleavage/methylation domain-containing protein
MKSKKLCMPRSCTEGGQRGFTLIEVMISIVVLTIGLVGLLSVFGVAMAATQASQQDMIAKQLANETVESIATARDSGQISWASIQNVSNGGIFLDAPLQAINQPGPDGIIGTADDAPAEVLTRPGPSGLITGASPPDVIVPLTNYQRTITIAPATIGGVPVANLRTINVTIQYTVPSISTPKQYTLSSLISQFR